MSKPVLCIIDVQPDFSASKQIVEQTIALATKFRRAGFPIFLVEYKGYGPGFDVLYNVLRDYSSLYRVYKSRDNGSAEVIACAEQHKVSLSRIVICGVNACFCVHDTAIGIMYNVSCDIVPARNACSCSCGNRRDCVPLLIDSIARAKRAIDSIARAKRDREGREAAEKQRAGQQ